MTSRTTKPFAAIGNSNTTSSGANRSRLSSAAILGVRLGLILLVVWLSLSTVRSIYQLTQSAPTTDKQEADKIADTPSPHNLLARLPAEGYWTFSDFNWRLARTEVAEGKSADVADDAPASLGPLSHEEESFLISLQALRDQATLLPAGSEHYRLGGQLPVNVVTQEVNGQTRLLSASIALPTGPTGEHHTVLRLLPKRTIDDSPAKAPHLLPLPVKSLRTFARWTKADELLLEFVSVPRRLDRVISDWCSAGWTVRVTPGLSGVGSSYLCAQDGRLIIVYVQQASDDSTDLLLAAEPRTSGHDGDPSR